MTTEPPTRPKGDTLDPNDPEAIRAWSAWLDIDEAKLIRLIKIVGTSAGQIEYILGKSTRSRW